MPGRQPRYCDCKGEYGQRFQQPVVRALDSQLYAATQPAVALWAEQFESFNPRYNQQAAGLVRARRHHHVWRRVPLYQSGQVIGGLGVSGDSSCADHAIAFRMRKLADLDGTPAGPNGNGSGADNIIYPRRLLVLRATANPRLLATALLGKRSHTSQIATIP